MKIDSNDFKHRVLSTAPVSSSTFSVDVNNFAHITRMLSKSLYSNPIRTLMIEYVQNAIDAHQSINSKEKIQVTIPTEEYPYYEVTDFGPGMSPEFVLNRLVLYGSSTKTATNKQAGGFGIGFKASAIYCDRFFMGVNYEGISYIYEVLNHEGSGSISLLQQTPTTERNGVTIQIEVNPSDIEKFNNTYRTLYNLLSDKLECFHIINGEKRKLDLINDSLHYIKIDDNTRIHYNTKGISYSDTSYVNIYSGGLFVERLSSEISDYIEVFNNNGYLYIQGHAGYMSKFDMNYLYSLFECYPSKRLYNYRLNFDINIPVGKFEMTINRESFIQSDELKCYIIEQLIKGIIEIISKQTEKINNINEPTIKKTINKIKTFYIVDSAENEELIQNKIGDLFIRKIGGDYVDTFKNCKWDLRCVTASIFHNFNITNILGVNIENIVNNKIFLEPYTIGKYPLNDSVLHSMRDKSIFCWGNIERIIIGRKNVVYRSPIIKEHKDDVMDRTLVLTGNLTNDNILQFKSIFEKLFEDIEIIPLLKKGTSNNNSASTSLNNAEMIALTYSGTTYVLNNIGNRYTIAKYLKSNNCTGETCILTVDDENYSLQKIKEIMLEKRKELLSKLFGDLFSREIQYDSDGEYITSLLFFSNNSKKYIIPSSLKSYALKSNPNISSIISLEEYCDEIINTFIRDSYESVILDAIWNYNIYPRSKIAFLLNKIKDLNYISLASYISCIWQQNIDVGGILSNMSKNTFEEFSKNYNNERFCGAVMNIFTENKSYINPKYKILSKLIKDDINIFNLFKVKKWPSLYDNYEADDDIITAITSYVYIFDEDKCLKATKYLFELTNLKK